LFVKVPRLGDSEVTFSVFDIVQFIIIQLMVIEGETKQFQYS